MCVGGYYEAARVHGVGAACVACGAHEIGNVPGDHARSNICDTGDMLGDDMDSSWWISYVRLLRVTLSVSLAIFYFLQHLLLATNTLAADLPLAFIVVMTDFVFALGSGCHGNLVQASARCHDSYLIYVTPCQGLQ